MIGLAYLAAGAVYLAITVWLVKWAARAAKRRGISGWKWGLPVALVMYLLVFWDWIPTVVAHKYYCSKYAGFTVYKTLDEWKQENPGVAETLDPEQLPEKFFFEYKLGVKRSERRFYRLPDGTELIAHYDVNGNYLYTDLKRSDGTSGSWLNQRFAWDIVRTSHPLHIQGRDESIVDMRTGEVLAQYIDYSTDIKPIALGARSLRDYKVWLDSWSCEPDGRKVNRKRFSEFKFLVKHGKEVY